MLYLLLGLIATEGLLLITWNRPYFSWACRCLHGVLR